MYTPVFAASVGPTRQPVRNGYQSITSPSLTDVRVGPKLLFGVSDSFESTRRAKPKALLPEETPLFFLHGLSSQGHQMDKVTEWVENADGSFPMYCSFIPEARDGIGIETNGSRKFEEAFPPYRLALRDLGAFRYQYVDRNIGRLSRALEQKGFTQTRQRLIGDYFEVLPELRGTLVPIIEEELIAPLFTVTDELTAIGIKRPLQQIASGGVSKIWSEVVKLGEHLKLKAEDRYRVIDTHYLYHAAVESGKSIESGTINLNPEILANNDDVINLRPINFYEIARLEAYLLVMERRLTSAIGAAFHDRFLKTSQRVSDDELHWLAQHTATKLLEKIAPQGMAFGFSQGGVLILTALMNYLSDRPQRPEPDLFKQYEDNPEILAGNYIGVGVFFNSPIMGLYRNQHPMADRLTEQFQAFMRSRDSAFRRMNGLVPAVLNLVKRIVWKKKVDAQPALKEMFVGSSLMNRVHQFVEPQTDGSEGPSVYNFRGTLVPVGDEGEIYVDNRASLLVDSQGNHPQNVFNMSISPFAVPDKYKTPDELIEVVFEFLGRDTRLYRRMVNFMKTRSAEFKQDFYDYLAPAWNQAARHDALMQYPHRVFSEMGMRILTDPVYQENLLHPQNFEPLRYQSLVVLEKVYDRDILKKPLDEAIEALALFMEMYPDFLDGLLANVREGVTVKNSAAYQATIILDQTLELLEKVSKRPDLVEAYQEPLQRYLGVISAAALPRVSNGLPDLCGTAEHILDRVATTLSD